MITVRIATPDDREVLGRFGGALVRQHYESDPRRFIQVDHPEAGYGRFLVGQISRPASTVLVAERSGSVIGYAWVTVENTNWYQLRGPSGVIQDIFVDEPARGLGAGRSLLAASFDWIRSKGRVQVVLMTKTRNEHAQHLFKAMGFRPTMMEMTLDLEGEETGHA